MLENARVNWWKKVEFLNTLKGYENLSKPNFYFLTERNNNMSKAKITEDEFTRFERLFFKIWHVYEFGNDKYYSLSDSEVEHLNNTLEQLKQEHPREHDIIIRHYLKRVYYTTIAREQNVSEGYIRKLCKNGAYYFLKLYDEK